MDKFSISDCKILWDKRVRVPRREKAAIKADLKTMSNIIEEAMSDTKGKSLKENRIIQMKVWLNIKIPDVLYYVEIHYDGGIRYRETGGAWLLNIYDATDEPDKCVGEIVSEKWPFMQMLLDEYVEEEAF